MNQAQEEYLERFCEHKDISKEQAMEYAVVKEVLKQLEHYKPPVHGKLGGDGLDQLSCNCS